MCAERVERGRGKSLYVNEDLSIPAKELSLRRTRSGGPGGQNVNKVATRIELLFDIGGSAVLSDDDKQRLRQKLGKRIDSRGILRVVAQSERTQARNEVEARKRLATALRNALRRPRPRRPTRPTQASKRARRKEKDRRARLKRQRRRPEEDDL